MLIQAYIKGDGSITVKENDRGYFFDNTGRFVKQDALTSDVVKGKRLYKAISVLSSCGDVEVAVFDDSTDIKKYKGDLSTVTKLAMDERGYIKRIQMTGVFADIRFTQMVFIYDLDKNLDKIIERNVKG